MTSDTSGSAQAERLRTMQSLTDASLSRLSEQDLLDELMSRVKALFHADSASMLLIDGMSGYLVPAGHHGPDAHVNRSLRIPVGKGFAGRVAAERKPVMVDRADGLSLLNPLMRDKGLQALLGVPLINGGRVIGVLQVGSATPRIFTTEDAQLLQIAADRAAAAVQSLADREDRRAAAALQRSLLPAELPAVAGIEMAAAYLPGTGAVGGDWYDVFPLPAGEVGLVIGDVAGSGLAAAVVMGRMRSALRAYALQTTDPAEVLRRLDRKIQYFENGSLATVQYAVASRDRSQVRISSAGHLPPVHATPDRAAEIVPVSHDLLIGLDVAARRHVMTIDLAPGSVLCSYTDGLVERPGEIIDAGIGRLRAILTATSPAAAIAEAMQALVGDAAPTDDTAIVALRRVPG